MKLRTLKGGHGPVWAGVSGETDEADAAVLEKQQTVQPPPLEGTAPVGVKRRCWVDANRISQEAHREHLHSPFSPAVSP